MTPYEAGQDLGIAEASSALASTSLGIWQRRPAPAIPLDDPRSCKLFMSGYADGVLAVLGSPPVFRVQGGDGAPGRTAVLPPLAGTDDSWLYQ